MAAALIGVALIGVSAQRGLGISIAVLLAAIGALALTARPWLVGALALSLVPATSGLLRGGVVPLFKVSEALVIFAAALVIGLRPSHRRLPWTRLDSSVAIFAIVSAALGLAHLPGDSEPLTSGLRVLLRPAFLFVIYRIVASGVVDGTQLRRAMRWAILATGPISFLTILQYFDAPGVRAMLINVVGGSSLMPTAQSHGTARATGPFPIWHSLDGYLLPFVLLAVALVMETQQTVLRRRWLWMILLLDAAALVTSLTLAVGIGLIVGVLALGILYGKALRVVVVLIAVGVAATVLFFPALQSRYEQQFGGPSTVSTSATPQTLTYRIQIWRTQFLPVIETHPVLGYGNQLPPDAAFQHTDNEYLTLLLRGGAPLLIATGVMVGGVTLAGLGLARRAHRPEARALGRAVAVAAVCPLLMGIVWPYITNAGFGEAWLGLAGLVRAAAWQQTPARRGSPSGLAP